jgi:Actinobacteria/chloroflexi VLRF1 release factor
VVVTAPDGAVAALRPPWPCPGLADAADPLPRLLADVRRPRVVGLLLVRRGGHAVGVAEGSALVDGKVGRRHVQGRTKAGGWSQQRYARRRRAQARQAFGAAADTAARMLLPHLSDLEGLVTGGDRAAVGAVLADARLARLGDLPQGRFLAVPDPRQAVLEDAVRRARKVAVDVWDPERD